MVVITSIGIGWESGTEGLRALPRFSWLGLGRAGI